jgi:hypothetical protein
LNLNGQHERVCGMTPILQLIRDIPHAHAFKVKIVLRLPTVEWLSNTEPLYSRAEPITKFTQTHWMVFDLFLDQMKGILPLAKLELESSIWCHGLIKKSPDLKILSLKEVTSIDLRDVGRYCRQLEELKLQYNSQIDLTFLDDSSQLIKLQVPYCRDITWFTKPQRKLDFLDCSYCQNMTEETLKAIVKNTPNLTSLNISGCPQLRSQALRVLMGTTIQKLWMNTIDLELEDIDRSKEFFSQLKHLSLVDCRINSEICYKLIAYAYQLAHLDLRDNPNISYDALHLLISNLECLKFLNIMGTTLNPDQIDKLKSLNINVKVIT